jgi:hypothetical protein
MISLSLILATLPSFSQTDTTSIDTIVCLPKSYLVRAIQEIKYGDFAKTELEIVNDNYTIAQRQLALKDSIIYKYERKEAICIADIGNLNQILDHKDDLITIEEKRARKYKRQKNGIVIGGVIVAVGLGVGVIFMAVQ